MDLLNLLEENKCNKDKVIKEIKETQERAEKRLKEFELMKEKDFENWLSKKGGMFAINSKEYYTSRFKNIIDNCKSTLENLDYDTSIIAKTNKELPCDYIIKRDYKGRLRQVKRIQKMLFNNLK